MKRALLALLILALLLPACAGAALAAGGDYSKAKTVYFTLSNDGVPVMGNDTKQTVLSHVKVTVPYFDLADYGLQDFYRYPSASFEEGGDYIGDEVVESPTMLHLYLYMLEKYYMGLADSACCQGNLDMDAEEAVNDMYGNSILNPNSDGNYNSALRISGGAKSMYMQNFWGHDENLMYYVNHQYPLQAAGWGSTADYILLEDGMTIDVSMFTDWSFWNDGGAFVFFDKDECYIAKGDTLTVQTLKTETVACEDGSSYESTPISGLNVAAYDLAITNDRGSDFEVSSDDPSKYSHTFTETGDYQILGLDPNKGTSDARFAPPSAIVHVLDALIPLTGLELDYSEYTLADAEPLKLNATLTPENATGVEITWKSSDAKVATVSKIGVVKTQGMGDCVITCTAKDSSGNVFTKECAITVQEKVDVESVALNETEIHLAVGDTYENLVATVLPENANKKSIFWTSSEGVDAEAQKIVRVQSNNGALTALQEGEVTIYAVSYEDPAYAKCTDFRNFRVADLDPETGLYATCKVIVGDTAAELTLDHSRVELAAGGSLTLKASAAGAVWSSSNSAVATVENGVVTAKGAGVAVITASANGQTATCTVAVERKIGKVSNDGGDKANVNDAVVILRSVTSAGMLSDEQALLADVNGDGVADVNDAIVLLRYTAGLVDSLTD